MKIFDNSNLAESYSGVTTPLTFSFARLMYQEVYKNFCRMMGTGKKTIEAHAGMFSEMVVCIGGRMYYDLTNWYRLISFLPGYSFNKGFFEEMLGVDRAADFEKESAKSFMARWLFYFPKTLWQAFKIFTSFLFMGVLVKKFNFSFDAIYTRYDAKDISQENERSLKDIFRRLTDTLVVRWRIPIANDFAVMVSTGIVRKLFRAWLPEKNPHAFLRAGNASPLISLDPGLAVMDIAGAIKSDNDFSALFQSNNAPEEILAALQTRYQGHAISEKIFDYIRTYGNRIPGELKLESQCLNEHPEILIQIITNAIQKYQPRSHADIRRTDVKDCDIGLLKRAVLSFFIRWSKQSIRMREETRFKRTLIFGFARRILKELGKRYSARNAIKSGDDVFYLTLEEVLGEVPAGAERLKSAVQKRKNAFALWKTIELPKRIETSLPIADTEKWYLAHRGEQGKTAAALKGTVVSTGGLKSVSDEALVMKEFDPSANFNDKIIIASHTDPGWSLVFPLMKGLVVERGGMLSHAAVAAREFGIPCIVGAEHATSMIRSAETIELNLVSGEITQHGKARFG